MKREVDLFFDLDGTIAETGRDLARSVNFMRRQMGLSELTEDEIKGFVGDGVRELIYRSLGERRELFDDAMKVFLSHYRAHLLDNTYVYPGVRNVSRTLGRKRKSS